MAKPWRLVPVAEFSLREIGRWTSETFGPQQAATCREKLIDACRQIAEGTAKSRVCRTYFDQRLSKDLRFVRCGQHFIVFIDDPDQVIIVEILHTRSDIPRKLAQLSYPDLHRIH